MILKPANFSEYAINQFHLLENNETGLSKAFAYVISKRPDIFFNFLRFLGLERWKSEKIFNKTSIEVEKFRNEGRTDIEIYCPNEFHVIIECKVGNNKITRQREQYIDSFYDVPEKYLCFISQTNDYKMKIHKDIGIKNIGWIDIDNLIDDRAYENDELIREFQCFLRRGYKLRNQKEILIQDLSDKTELIKYKQFNVYRRDTIFGSPLYFSPYFTRQADQEKEGIWYISKILGIITAKPIEIISFKDDLKIFSDSKELLVDKWLSGVKLDSENKIYTYFFLDNPVKLNKPLLKDGGIEKGRGKNWIAAKIPKNRCVTFQEFVKRMTV